MIKKFLFSALVIGLITSCNNQKTTTNNEPTASEESIPADAVSAEAGVIEYENTSFDFGKVKEGEIVEHIFKFKNTGNSPVILAQVSASCGCTTPDYTKEPILPGKEGEVKVVFNSDGQVGNQQKIVTVISNAENKVTTVQIKGTVEI